MFEETCMKTTGLILRPVSAASIAQARQRPVEGDTKCMCSLDRWQPDWIFVSHELRKIAIVDLCRPSDVHPEQLRAAAIRKQDGYAPLVLALCHYIEEGWTVQVFPWVVGIRGLIDPSLIVSLLNFLDIPSKYRNVAVERTVLASVRALYFMHQVRFGGMYGRMRAVDSRQNNSSDDEKTDDEELRSDPSSRQKKRLAQAAGRKPTGLQPVPVSGTTARHTTAERTSLASEQAVTKLIAEEAMAYNDTRAAANTIMHAVGEVMLLVTAATEATLTKEESQVAPTSPVPNTTESTTTTGGPMGCAVGTAVTDVVGAVATTTVRNADLQTARATRSRKRKADRGHSEDLRISSKSRPSSGGDHNTLDAFQEGYSSCLTGDQLNQPPESTVRVSSLTPKSRPMFRVQCLGQSSESTRVNSRTAGVNGSSNSTLSSHAFARIQCLSNVSESDAQVARSSRPSEPTTQASRLSQLPESADQVGCPDQLAELTTQVCRQDQVSDGPVRDSHQAQSPTSGIRVGRRSPSPESAVQVSQLSQSPQSAYRVSHPSQSSNTLVRGSCPSQPSESATRISRPSQLSEPVVRVHRPSLSSESAARPSHLGQPTSRSLPVPLVRPVEPRQLKQRKRPRTVSASHTWDTNDPLQEPTPKRRSAPQAQANDLWTQWRNLAQDGRRSS